MVHHRTLHIVNLILITFISFYITNVISQKVVFNLNSIGLQHHTREFYLKNRQIRYPIIRRGASFSFDILTKFDINRGERLSFRFKILTLIKKRVFFVSGEKLKTRYLIKTSRKIQVKIFIPGTFPIGSWTVKIGVRLSNNREFFAYIPYMVCLLNPLSKFDVVYTDNKVDLENHFFSQYDVAYRGNSQSIWMSGQYSEITLNATFKALRASNITALQLGDALVIGKWLNRMTGVGSTDLENENISVNCILLGIWTNDITPPEKHPTYWVASTQILRLYLQKGSKVKYAQCWVYASVFVSLARSIGFVARMVVGHSIAVDKDSSIDVDIGSDENVYKDIIWNYHAWAEIHLRRKKKIYTGWHVMDPTPQTVFNHSDVVELVPVLGIKLGDVEYSRKLQVLFSNVNADANYFGATHKIYSTMKQKVGKRITYGYVKDGKLHSKDITNLYKFKEGSKQERNVYSMVCDKMKRIYAKLSPKEKYDVKPPCPYKGKRIAMRSALSDEFVTEIHTPNLEIGKDINVVFSVKYLLKQAKNVTVFYEISLRDNSNSNKLPLRRNTHSMVFSQSNPVFTEKLIGNPIKVKEYINNVNFYNYLSVVVKIFTGDDIMRKSHRQALQLPPLIVEYKKVEKKDKSFKIKAIFENSLPIKLQDCLFTIINDEIDVSPVEMPILKPNEKHEISFDLMFMTTGIKTISISFYTSSLSDRIDKLISVDIV